MDPISCGTNPVSAIRTRGYVDRTQNAVHRIQQSTRNTTLVAALTYSYADHRNTMTNPDVIRVVLDEPPSKNFTERTPFETGWCKSEQGQCTGESDKLPLSRVPHRTTKDAVVCGQRLSLVQLFTKLVHWLYVRVQTSVPIFLNAALVVCCISHAAAKNNPWKCRQPPCDGRPSTPRLEPIPLSQTPHTTSPLRNPASRVNVGNDRNTPLFDLDRGKHTRRANKTR